MKAKGGIVLSTYEGSENDILVQCSNDHRWNTKSKYVRDNRWCKECFMNRSRQAKQNFYDLVTKNGGVVLGEYINTDTKILVRCRNDHEWKPIPYRIKAGCWCPKCSGHYPQQAKEDFFNAVAKKGGVVIGQYINVSTNVLIKCSCGNECSPKPCSVKAGRWCPKCQCSKGEAAVSNYLTKKNVRYKHNKAFMSNSQLRADFNIEDYELIIEFDGQQHFREIAYFGRKRSLEEQRESDLTKDMYCYHNKIHILRIPYTVMEDIDEFLDPAFHLITNYNILLIPFFQLLQ